jgi:hypothetical protein
MPNWLIAGDLAGGTLVPVHKDRECDDGAVAPVDRGGRRH